MKTRTKILLDAVIGGPAILMLNMAARTLGFFLRINHSLNRPVKTIAVSKFLGLGSIIQATPLLKALRKKHPEAKLIFVTVEGNRRLVENLGISDGVLTISDKGIGALTLSSLRLLINLWKSRPQLFIDLEFHSYYSNIISTLSLSTNRLGYFKKNKKYRKGVYTHMIKFDQERPITETYLEFAMLLNCREIGGNLLTLLSEQKLERAAMQAFEIAGLNPNEEYIIVNPNASDLRLERRWPKESFVNLIGRISDNVKIVLIGNNKEKDYVDAIESMLRDRKNVINTSGRLDLDQLIALIAKCRLIITNDTGPMHMALAMKSKTIALFGPCSPQQYGNTKDAVTIYKKVACSPCVHDHITPPCRGNNICMKNISVDEVYSAFEKAYSEREDFKR